MRTTHEEADVIIIGQIQTAIAEGNTSIAVYAKIRTYLPYYVITIWQKNGKSSLV